MPNKSDCSYELENHERRYNRFSNFTSCCLKKNVSSDYSHNYEQENLKTPCKTNRDLSRSHSHSCSNKYSKRPLSHSPQSTWKSQDSLNRDSKEHGRSSNKYSKRPLSHSPRSPLKFQDYLNRDNREYGRSRKDYRRSPLENHKKYAKFDSLPSSKENSPKQHLDDTPITGKTLDSPSKSTDWDTMVNEAEMESNRNKIGSNKPKIQRRLVLLNENGRNEKRKPREFETDLTVLQRRQKQIDYGKNTIAYDCYLTQVPRCKRTKDHPTTPNKYLMWSRRSWDTQIKLWRRNLHKYDPPVKSGEKLEPIDFNLDISFGESNDILCQELQNTSLTENQPTSPVSGKTSSNYLNEFPSLSETMFNSSDSMHTKNQDEMASSGIGSQVSDENIDIDGYDLDISLLDDIEDC